MCDSRLIVLKFGGSVLTNETTLRYAAHEIVRWRRKKHSVVAVVSALAGVTDAMFGKCQQFGGEPAPASVAAVVSTGEIHSAAMLTLHLDCAGMSAALLTPAAIGLVAAGPPLDASPTDISAAPLQRTLGTRGSGGGARVRCPRRRRPAVSAGPRRLRLDGAVPGTPAQCGLLPIGKGRGRALRARSGPTRSAAAALCRGFVERRLGDGWLDRAAQGGAISPRRTALNSSWAKSAVADRLA